MVLIRQDNSSIEHINNAGFLPPSDNNFFSLLGCKEIDYPTSMKGLNHCQSKVNFNIFQLISAIKLLFYACAVVDNGSIFHELFLLIHLLLDLMAERSVSYLPVQPQANIV